jgi:hypothetical protein
MDSIESIKLKYETAFNIVNGSVMSGGTLYNAAHEFLLRQFREEPCTGLGLGKDSGCGLITPDLPRAETPVTRPSDENNVMDVSWYYMATPTVMRQMIMRMVKDLCWHQHKPYIPQTADKMIRDYLKMVRDEAPPDASGTNPSKPKDKEG